MKGKGSMEHGKESIIYHLTEKQSLAINRVGIIPAESDSPIDIYNMQLPQDIAEHIITYFNGIGSDDVFICCGRKNPEYIEFDNLPLQENTKLYLFFKIECECDTDVIISAKTDFVTRTWLNGRFVISYPTPLITRLNAGENLFILESKYPHDGAYIHYRINTLFNEYEKQPLSYIRNNLQNFTGRFWWLNKEYDTYGKGKVEYILLPLDEVNVDIKQKMEACIYSYDPPALLDSFDNYFYKTHTIDLSKYDYCISKKPNHLVFQVTCHTKDGRVNRIERRFFLYPVIDDPSYWVNAAQRLVDSGKLSPDECNCLGFYIQAVVDPDKTLREGRDDSVYLLAEAIEEVESGEYMQNLYTPGHKYMYIHSELDGRYVRVGIHLPDGYRREQTYPLLLFMLTSSSLHHEKAMFMENYQKEAVISADVSGRGVTLGSYVGEASSLEILEDVKRHFPINEERIYMIGYSNGGFAAFALAQSMPDKFAGICSAGGDLYLPNYENLYHIKVISIIPEADSMNRGEMIQKLSKLSNYTELLGDKTVHSDLEKLFLNENIISSLLSSRLERYPNQIVFRTERNRHLRSYWLRLHSIAEEKDYAVVKAEIIGNEIVITCKNATGITINLPPQIKRSRFKVSINKKVFEFQDFAEDVIHFIHKARGYCQSAEPLLCLTPYKGNGLLDVYMDPLCILCCDAGNEVMAKTAAAFSEPATNGFDPKVHVKYPIITLDTITENVFYDHSLIVIDSNIKSNFLDRIRENGSVITDEMGYEYHGERYQGAYSVMQIVQNPWNPKYHIVYINTNDSKLFSKNLFTRTVCLPAYINGRHPYLNQNILIWDEMGYKTGG